jgi:hypothetical protein
MRLFNMLLGMLGLVPRQRVAVLRDATPRLLR